MFSLLRYSFFLLFIILTSSSTSASSLLNGYVQYEFQVSGHVQQSSTYSIVYSKAGEGEGWLAFTRSWRVRGKNGAILGSHWLLRSVLLLLFKCNTVNIDMNETTQSSMLPLDPTIQMYLLTNLSTYPSSYLSLCLYLYIYLTISSWLYIYLHICLSVCSSLGTP